MSLPFVSIDIWTIIMQWGNLLLLMWLIKKFLFKPVMSVLKAREDEIKSMYNDAENARGEADRLKEEYAVKLNAAREEADDIVKTAVQNAKSTSDEIISDAQDKANSLVARANEKIEVERKAAINHAKNDLSDMAIAIAGKVIERDINAADHSEMIDKFIEELGDAS